MMGEEGDVLTCHEASHVRITVFRDGESLIAGRDGDGSLDGALISPRLSDGDDLPADDSKGEDIRFSRVDSLLNGCSMSERYERIK